MTNRIHLAAFLIAGNGAHSHALWRHPQSWPGGFLTADYYQRIATSLERGVFDLVFFADRLAVSTQYGGSHKFGLRHGDQDATRLDPIPVLSTMSCVTQRIGLGGTRSTTYAQPYELARAFSTLDHLSKGRAAWNVVTSVNRGEADNFGVRNSLEHDARYDRADEFLEAVFRLWDGWAPDALRLDQTSGVYADPEKVARADFEGRWIRTAGPLNIPRSPQGRPVIIQAGSSARGQDFAARWAEIVFSIQPDLPRMQRFYDDFKSRLAHFCRDPGAAKVLTAVMPFVGESEAEARDKQAQHNALVDPYVGLSTLSSHMNVDFSRFPLDTPIADISVQGMQGIFSIIKEMSHQDGLTLADVGRLYGEGVLVPQIVGTASQVADQLIQIFKARGADGFVVSPAYLPGGFDDFVDGVVPLLQRERLFPTEYKGKTLREHLGSPVA